MATAHPTDTTPSPELDTALIMAESKVFPANAGLPNSALIPFEAHEWAQCLRASHVTDKQLLASGFVTEDMLPGQRYKSNTGGKRGAACRLERCKDGTINAHISFDLALTRNDPVLQKALELRLKQERERAEREAERRTISETKALPFNVNVLMDLTQGMDVPDMAEIARLIDDWRRQRGMREARAADVVDLTQWRNLRK